VEQNPSRGRLAVSAFQLLRVQGIVAADLGRNGFGETIG
jgi:hypothetical protein